MESKTFNAYSHNYSDATAVQDAHAIMTDRLDEFMKQQLILQRIIKIISLNQTIRLDRESDITYCDLYGLLIYEFVDVIVEK